jgi:periplasmic protein TonB
MRFAYGVLHAGMQQSMRDLNPDSANSHLDRLLAPSVEEPWYHSLIRSVKDAVRPPVLPPLEVTSKPVAVQDIWGLYGKDKRSNMTSLAIHITAVVLLFTVASSRIVQMKATETFSTLIAPEIAPYLDAARKQQMGGGGGGDRSPVPAPKGKLPKLSSRQFAPPMVVANNSNPSLIMEPTILVPPDVQLPNVNLPNYGDPLAKNGPPSNGPGSGGGIGNGSGDGVGPGKGPGFGPGEGRGVAGVYRVGGGVSAPQILFKVDPEYSEEARKAKYSGTVILQLVVDPSGRGREIRVVHSLGLGLDEKAIEALNKWKFRPGLRDGQPVAVMATIEVNFRLL